MNKEGGLMRFVSCLLPLAFCFLPVLLSGCASAPPERAAAEVTAIELNRKAGSAFRQSDYKTALELYGRALKVSSSVEYADGMAINLINMAVTYRKIGDRENAHKCLGEVLNPRHVIFDPSHLSEAAYIQAVLYVDEGKYPAAVDWSDKALDFCNNEKCKGKGKIYNLKSRIAMINNAPESAIAFGLQGLELNRKAEDRQEEANSLRLIADARTASGSYKEAEGLYRDALAIDKAMGLSGKIWADLMGIGNDLSRQGRKEDAAAYYERAESVSRNSGDEKRAVLRQEETGKCAK